MAAAPKQSLRIAAGDVAEFFVGEKGWGYGKKRNGIYFRPGVRKPSRPRGMFGLNLPEDDHAFNAAMKGWCEALKIRCEGFVYGDMPDPVWLEGPQQGEVSGTAEDVLAEMAQGVGAALEPAPEPAPGQRQKQSSGGGGTNVLAYISLAVAVLAGVVLFLSCVLTYFYPVGSMGTCVVFLMAGCAIVLGIIALITGKGSGTLPAVAGLILGGVMLVSAFVVPFVFSYLLLGFRGY